MPIKNVLFDNSKDFEEVQKFLPVTAAKKITVIFCSMFKCLSGGFQKKQASLTVQQLKKIREQQRNEIRRQNYINFISLVLTTNYEFKKAKS